MPQEDNEKLPNGILRAGVAFAFLYPAIAAWFSPTDWIGYFPQFLIGYVPDLVLLHSFGLSEVFIGLWILSGKKIFIPSVLASLYLTVIIIFNLNGFDVIFRDISILSISLYLAIKNLRANP